MNVPQLIAAPTPPRETLAQGAIAYAEVRERVAPPGWDRWVQELGGGPFHCTGWARYRASSAHKQALFFAWYLPGSLHPVAVALGVDSSLPGPFRARSVEFDAPPATRLDARRLVGAVQRWMRSQRGVADAWLGSFDANQAWTGAVGSPTRIELRVTPAPEDELAGRMRTLARRSLRRARESGIEVDANSAELGGFVNLYGETLERLRRTKDVSTALGDRDIEVRRLTRLRQDGVARLFLACEHGTPVAGALFTVFARRAFYLSGGTNDAGRRTGAMTAVLHRAISEFSAAGFVCVNLGGVSAGAPLPSSPDHGLYAFKRGMGAVAHPCHDSRIVVRPARCRLVQGARDTRSAVLRLRANARLTLH